MRVLIPKWCCERVWRLYVRLCKEKALQMRINSAALPTSTPPAAVSSCHTGLADANCPERGLEWKRWPQFQLHLYPLPVLLHRFPSFCQLSGQGTHEIWKKSDICNGLLYPKAKGESGAACQSQNIRNKSKEKPQTLIFFCQIHLRKTTQDSTKPCFSLLSVIFKDCESEGLWS